MPNLAFLATLRFQQLQFYANSKIDLTPTRWSGACQNQSSYYKAVIALAPYKAPLEVEVNILDRQWSQIRALE